VVKIKENYRIEDKLKIQFKHLSIPVKIAIISAWLLGSWFLLIFIGAYIGVLTV